MMQTQTEIIVLFLFVMHPMMAGNLKCVFKFSRFSTFCHCIFMLHYRKKNKQKKWCGTILLYITVLLNWFIVKYPNKIHKCYNSDSLSIHLSIYSHIKNNEN